MTHYPTRVRYGLRLLVRLALQEDPWHLSMRDISVVEGISIKYLEQIVALLKPAGILESARGSRGGYALACDPSEISLDVVFEHLGGIASPAPCFMDGAVCDRMKICTTRPFWVQFDANVRSYLRSVTLADIVAQSAFIPPADPPAGTRRSFMDRSEAQY